MKNKKIPSPQALFTAQKIFEQVLDQKFKEADKVLRPFVSKRIDHLYTQIFNKVKSSKQ